MLVRTGEIIDMTMIRSVDRDTARASKLAGLDVYRLVNYFDVWGNEKDGFEVNDLCYAGWYVVSEKATNKHFIKTMRKDLGVKPRLRLQVNGDCGEMIEIEHKSSGEPIGRWEKIYDAKYI